LRGRRPTTGLKKALKIAEARGGIMKLSEDIDRVADFIIRSPGRLVFVRAMRVTRLRCAPEDLDAECQRTIRVLRTLPGYGPVVRELWAYTRHGFRFFRISDATIERIDKDGNSAEERQRIEQGSPAPTGSPAEPEPMLTLLTTPETRLAIVPSGSPKVDAAPALPPQLLPSDSPVVGGDPGASGGEGEK